MTGKGYGLSDHLHQEFYIDSDGIQLHAKLDLPAGEKAAYPLVIVVHGFTGHMEEDHYRLTAEALQTNGYAVLRVELYGHGQSDGKFEDHTLLKWVSELLDVIDYAQTIPHITELYLLGHSAGGLAVVLAGGIRHSAIRALLPLSPAISIRDGARTGHVLGADFDPVNIPDEVYFPNRGDVAPGLMLRGNYFRSAQFLPVEEAAEAFDGPVLLLHGDADETIPVECSIDLEKHFSRVTFKIIHDDTHCYDRHLDEVIREILLFLNDVSGKADGAAGSGKDRDQRC